MLKLGAAFAAAVVAFTVSSAAFADQMGTHNMMNADHMMTGGKKVTLTGQVVDLSCYLGSGLKGAGHKVCAKACLRKGQPFGIQTSDGNIITVFGKGPNDRPLEKIEPFLEEKVTVTGEEFTNHGVTGIRIDTIAAAK